MAQKAETNFKNKIRPHLLSLPNSWWKKIQQITIRGVPDYLGCVNVVFCSLELKADEQSKVAELQLYNLKHIELAGGYARIVTPSNWMQTYQELQLISELGPNALKKFKGRLL